MLLSTFYQIVKPYENVHCKQYLKKPITHNMTVSPNKKKLYIQVHFHFQKGVMLHVCNMFPVDTSI